MHGGITQSRPDGGRFDGYVLIGDDTAIGEIGRRLHALPLGTPAFVVVEVEGPHAQTGFVTLADLTLHWVHRQARRGPRTLNDAVRGLFLPQNDVHVWVACAPAQARLIAAQLVEDHGVNPDWLDVACAEA
jgi:NADPH-dependent ferric siderophore reductase